MDSENWKAVGAGATLVGIVGLCGAGGYMLVKSSQNMNLGTDRAGVSWQVEQPLFSRDLKAEVDGSNAHRITDVTIIDPKTGDIIALPRKDGETKFTVPYSWSGQDFQVVACVDGRWQASPEARTASVVSVKNSTIAIDNYDGPRVSPVDIPQLGNGSEICLN